jgi:hypothetical protein
MYRILSAAATNDLTTLTTVKHELAISDGDSPSPHDERLIELIGTASDIVAQLCNRDTFGRQTIEQTEYLRQPTQGIVLAFDINPEITSVTLNDVELSPTEYVLDGSILRHPPRRGPAIRAGPGGMAARSSLSTMLGSFFLLVARPRAICRGRSSARVWILCSASGAVQRVIRPCAVKLWMELAALPTRPLAYRRYRSPPID